MKNMLPVNFTIDRPSTIENMRASKKGSEQVIYPVIAAEKCGCIELDPIIDSKVKNKCLCRLTVCDPSPLFRPAFSFWARFTGLRNYHSTAKQSKTKQSKASRGKDEMSRVAVGGRALHQASIT